MKIGIANDHRGYELKEYLRDELRKKGYDVMDYGTFSTESVDYPDYARLITLNVNAKNVDFGVAICGTGIGISIACNKVKGIRCAKVSNVEEAIHTREDNDANIVALGEKTSKEDALNIVKAFINTPFSNSEKHIKRLEKIRELEEENGR